MPFSAQLEKIKKGKTWRFFGGIKPLERKATSDCPIEELPVPSLITLPVDRHLGEGGRILVNVGDRVKAGQRLTIPGGRRNVPLHASTSGEVTGIGMQVLPHPSGFTGRCVTIKPDGLDESVPPQLLQDWENRAPQEILEQIRSFGVEGLGGAQFQTAAKIEAALEEATGDCNIFIVNGAECEPVATCDDRLMQEKADEIAVGIEVIRRVLNPKVIMVAIEDNKPKAFEAMKKAVAPDVIMRKIPTLYPSGAARNLIKICTGIEIPYSEHTSECGIVVDNVETVYAVKQAVVDGLPLIKRVVTVDGLTLGRRGNALIRLGTSVRFVLNCYRLNPERRQRIIIGGPFMGFTLPSIDVPVTKSTTCIFAPSVKEVEEREEQMNCIRCGRCARVCPSRLTPYQLYALSRAGRHDKTLQCGMKDCTECGCCAYVCPSRIPLSGQFRKEKAILRILEDNRSRNIRAKERMAARNDRLREEEERRRKRREEALRRKALLQADPDTLSEEEMRERRNAQIAEARERAAARRKAAEERTGIRSAGGETEALRTAEAQSAKQRSAAADEAEEQDPLPTFLRRGDGAKHAPVTKTYPALPESAQDLSIVENPPKEGERISTGVIKRRSYLNYGTASAEVKDEGVPVNLRRKDYAEYMAEIRRKQEEERAAKEAERLRHAKEEEAALRAGAEAEAKAGEEAETAAEAKAKEEAVAETDARADAASGDGADAAKETAKADATRAASESSASGALASRENASDLKDPSAEPTTDSDVNADRSGDRASDPKSAGSATPPVTRDAGSPDAASSPRKGGGAGALGSDPSSKEQLNNRPHSSLGGWIKPERASRWVGFDSDDK